MRFGQYPSYRPNSIEWLPVLPHTWQHVRARFVLGVNSSPVKQRELDDSAEVSFVPMEAVGEYGGLNLDRTKLLDEVGIGYTAFEDGDVVVAKITPCFENGKGALADGLVNGVAFGTTELHVLRAGTRLDRRFLFYLTMSHTFRALGESEMYGAGGQKRVPPEFVKDFRVPLPPIDEQQGIGRFLDAQTARIDQLLAKKRDLIETLKEKRSALISRAIIVGLPTKAVTTAELHLKPDLKDSGTALVREIPQTWNAVPLSHLVRMRGGATPDKGKPEYWDGEIPWVSPKDMKVASIDETEDHISEEGLQKSALSVIPIKSVLIVVRGMILAHSFPVAISERELTINQDMKALVCGKRVRPEFLYWALCGFSKALVALADESAHGTKKIESTTLARFPIFVPPINEQQAIADYLDSETRRLDNLAAKVESAITRLLEYRQALITSAVTGKIDVRHRQAPALQAA